MLTKAQEGYLQTIPEDRIAHVVAFDPKSQEVANQIMEQIKTALPHAVVTYLGSSKLGIAGENDIDLQVLSGDNFSKYAKELEKLFGKPLKNNVEKKRARWEFTRENFPVELYLTDIMTPNLLEQIDTQVLLESDERLRKEYESLKLKANGLPYREYLKMKYEFWNRILEKRI